ATGLEAEFGLEIARGRIACGLWFSMEEAALLLEQISPQQFEGLLAGDLFEGGAVEAVDWVQHEGMARRGQGNEDRADRLGFRAAGWTGDAGDGDGIVRTESGARAFSHFPDGGFADRAVLRQSFGADAEKFLLGFVGIGDESTQKYRRSAGDIRHAVGNVAAGAGFREDEGLLAFGQEADNGGVELVVLIAENMRAELAADDGFGFGDEFAGGVAAGHETDVHLAVMSAIAEFQPRAGERFEEGGDFF